MVYVLIARVESKGWQGLLEMLPDKSKTLFMDLLGDVCNVCGDDVQSDNKWTFLRKQLLATPSDDIDSGARFDRQDFVHVGV